MKEAEESLDFIWGTYSGKTKNMSKVPGSPWPELASTSGVKSVLCGHMRGKS